MANSRWMLVFVNETEASCPSWYEDRQSACAEAQRWLRERCADSDDREWFACGYELPFNWKIDQKQSFILRCSDVLSTGTPVPKQPNI